jgi:hypothetical protein
MGQQAIVNQAAFNIGQMADRLAGVDPDKQDAATHCCPVVRSSMVDYALIGKDLRVKRNVSDLKVYPLFWRGVLGKKYFFASCRTDPSATVPPMRGAVPRRLQS